MCWWTNEKATDQIRGFILGTKTGSSFLSCEPLKAELGFFNFEAPALTITLGIL